MLAFVHKDLHHAAEKLVRHFHLNPASRFPRIFIDLSGHITSGQLWMVAAGALLYAGLRFVEAYGLWRERHWAEWFAVITGGVYIPVELFEITRGLTWPKLSLLIVNAGIVTYLSIVLYQSKQRRTRWRRSA